MISHRRPPRLDGHYWVRFAGETDVTVGRFTGLDGDGAPNPYPWETIASDEIFCEHQIEVIMFIEPPPMIGRR